MGGRSKVAVTFSCFSGLLVIWAPYGKRNGVQRNYQASSKETLRSKPRAGDKRRARPHGEDHADPAVQRWPLKRLKKFRYPPDRKIRDFSEMFWNFLATPVPLIRQNLRFSRVSCHWVQKFRQNREIIFPRHSHQNRLKKWRKVSPKWGGSLVAVSGVMWSDTWSQ